jgi:hypothetical protein
VQVKKKSSLLMHKLSVDLRNRENGAHTRVEVHAQPQGKELQMYIRDRSQGMFLPIATVKRRVQTGWSEAQNRHHHIDVLTVTAGVDIAFCVLLCASYDQLMYGDAVRK